MGDGAWSWFGDPRAVAHGGRTYVGWVDRQGDVKVSSYEHATGKRITSVLQARLNEDDHANPSIFVRPDGRLTVFYSRHVGPAMHYRTSTAPGDITSWGPTQTMPSNVTGGFGYTYPNPIRLPAESATYLLWRGGNYNPTYSVQKDGETAWSPARNLIRTVGERPYVKYDSSGGDTIHLAYTEAHPNEVGSASVNIWYARVRAGKIEAADGQELGTLANAPMTATSGQLVFDDTVPTWVHDVAADSAGRPVIVFARFVSAADHRYMYAHWTGSAWEVHEITPAGGSIREDGGSPYYSGGITLDHEDPSRVYLSRQVGSGWQVESWTTAAHGTSWAPQVLDAGGKNLRPVSPRGMTPAAGELDAIWMKGAYPDYFHPLTTITAFTPLAANSPPVADTEPAVRAGRAPLGVRFDTSMSRDADGSIVSYQWDFGDGTTGTGPDPTHTYTTGGRYFAKLTVTDDDGASSTVVDEISVDVPTAPTVWTGGASGTTVHGAVVPENQQTRWYLEYGPTEEYGARTTAQTLPGDATLRQVSTQLAGLQNGRLYHYRVVADNNSGSTSGEDRVMVANATPGSDSYRSLVTSTSGVVDYWRLGELSGTTARDTTSTTTGPLSGRYVLGRPGVLGRVRDTAASFDGRDGELAISGAALGANATMEGWFRWRAGTTPLRDSTSAGGTGWILAFPSASGNLAYRLGGTGFTTTLPIGAVRDGNWHYLAATKQGTAAALYVDGARVHSSATGAGSQTAIGPWHVMRNGTNAVFSEGDADEVALYTRALSATEVKARWDRAKDLADDPLPPGPSLTVVDPPAAGSGQDGGVLEPGVTSGGTDPGAGTTGGGTTEAPAVAPRSPRGVVRLVGRTLVARGAAGVRNDLLVRRRGGRWIVRDRLAALRAGDGCRRIGARVVSCRAAGVRRVLLYGGAGNDRLTVIGRIAVTFRGGPGRDVELRRLS